MAPVITRADHEIRQHTFEWRAMQERVALIPTMGALHAGHLSLIDTARNHAERIVVSIFVNPAQFGEGEDFEDYPRTWESDIDALTAKGVDAVYAPGTKTMYPDGYTTSITLNGPADELETESRPHFFTGVATVVAKLLLGVLPDVAIFGEKDYQQLLVVTQMAKDLQIPVTILGAATLRGPDGLALSSRNAYLTPAERKIAPMLHTTLKQCAEAIRDGDEAVKQLEFARARLTDLNFTIDYIELRNADTLNHVNDIENESLRLLAAVTLGTTRLIDNIAV